MYCVFKSMSCNMRTVYIRVWSIISTMYLRIWSVICAMCILGYIRVQ